MAGVALNMLGWAVTGFAVRAWQLGIMGRPYIGRDLKTLKHHFSYAAIFGVAGYFIYGLEQSQYAAVERRRDQLLEARRQRGLVTEEA